MKNLTAFSQFQIKKAEKMAEDYRFSTGMECFVIPTRENSAGNTNETTLYIDNAIESSGSFPPPFAVKFGTPQLPSASKGFIHWASPIVHNKQIVAILTAGQIVTENSWEAMSNTLSSAISNNTTDHDSSEITKYLLINERRMRSLRNMLDVAAHSCSDRNISEEDFHKICCAFRKKYDLDIPETANIPWENVLNAIFRQNRAETEFAYRELLAKIRENRNTRTIRFALAQLLLSLRHYALAKKKFHFLAEYCLNALNELACISFLAELYVWAKQSLHMIVEACAHIFHLNDSDMLHQVIQYIEAHYHEKISLQEISDKTHFASSYFCKRFKRETGITFSKFLICVRIEKSKLLLKNTAYSLAKISSMVGFEEQSYFTKVFRDTTGISPGKYRRRILA